MRKNTVVADDISNTEILQGTKFDYPYFENRIYQITGIDLFMYKEKQMMRRVNTLMKRKGYADYKEFADAIQEDEDLREFFLDYITINVTDFFRAKEQWELFENELIPELIERFGKKLKIWSAGCSSGEEAYSMAMLLTRYLDISNIHIIATDIDKRALERAKEGIYSSDALQRIPEDFREKFFIKSGHRYQVKDELKACIDFCKHDILCDSFPQECHLIVCKNMLIYFTDNAKHRIFKGFHKSLITGGILFLGNAEQIIYYKKYGFIKQCSSIYKATR